MELIANRNPQQMILDTSEIVSKSGTNFIEANTKSISLNHLRKDCTIPVFAKDNESTISHFEFIDAVNDLIKQQFPNEIINRPEIRVSHIIKGRTPDAIGIPAKELKEHQKTIYYERMAFIIEIPSLTENVNRNSLSLTVGGVRSYSEQNLYSKKSLEKFKVFIGFKNMVCLNLCISTDGYMDSIRIGTIGDLEQHIKLLLSNYNKERHLGMLEKMSKYQLLENQFAHLIGKLRMYQNLPKEERNGIFPFGLNDSQVNQVVKDYYRCPNFSRNEDGSINLYNLYNILTEANKSSYIDSNFERNVNAYEFINKLGNSIEFKTKDYFLP
ncbi:DUF3871 family protein [Seonamhaeicola sediminis]|uniref:DUF3871 family protein n=1 Tax=Seonamhaeicola sediminis TaxID=2528206 RepID=A0A562YBM8_9FLAO|nr:DUF3871 family protein [Seonamhaeicola sediminis]TWO31506.1 DUF3871 family protein [Seonamhaeicola sediminis]